MATAGGVQAEDASRMAAAAWAAAPADRSFISRLAEFLGFECDA